jgi:integrase
MERWLEDSAKGDLAPRTYHNYRLQIRRHISPAFGRLKLSRLTAAHIQSLYAAKLRGGLKPASVRYIHAVLHRALEQAVRFNLIPFNPASRVDPPKVRQEEITPLDSEQARAFLSAARGDRFEALHVISLTVGLRMGEALGLRWSDIDFNAKTLRVSRQLQRVRDGGGLVFSEPKNASRRTVDLPQRAVEALRSHRKRQLEEKIGHWRSHVFLRSLLVPATLSKRSIPPFDRFELLFGQPFTYVGFEAEGGKEVREHHHMLES